MLALKRTWLLFLLGNLPLCSGCHSRNGGVMPPSPPTPWTLSYRPPEAPTDTPSIAEAMQGVKAMPNAGKAHYDLGLAFYKKGDYQQAIREFNESRRLAPDNPSSYFSLGYSYSALGETQHAIGVFQALVHLKLRPKTRSAALLGLGNCQWDIKNLPGAERAYRDSLKANPREASALYGLGLIAALKNDLAGAQQYFNSTVTHADSGRLRAKGHLALGRLARQRGDAKAALDEINVALKEVPGNREILAALKEVRSD